jgi:hypothetical protein
MVQGSGGLRGAIERLGGPSGAEREMTVRRGSQTLTVRFVLADYLQAESKGPPVIPAALRS